MGKWTALYWIHKDRRGSPVVIADQSGVLLDPLAYDAWGKRRSQDGASTDDEITGKVDNKGFTGHEMLDTVDLVHMNGRVYDPQLGRFLSADPLVQDPLNGQSYNRYSYVLNNPTNLTDPSGFQAECKLTMCGAGDWKTIYQAPSESGAGTEKKDKDKGQAAKKDSNGTVVSDAKKVSSANKVTEAVGQFVDNVKHTSVGQIVTGAPEAIQTVIVTGSRVARDLYEYGFGNRNAALESLRQHQADNLQLLTIVGQFWRGNGLQGMAAKRPKPVATPEIGSALNKGPVYKTTKEATQAADELGFRKVNETSHGQAVYTDGKIFITRDVDGHNGGAWKGADSVKALSSKDTRAGTFDVNLQRIGD